MTTFCVHAVTRETVFPVAERRAHDDVSDEMVRRAEKKELRMSMDEQMAFFRERREFHIARMLADPDTKAKLISTFYSSPDRCRELIEVAQRTGAKNCSIYVRVKESYVEKGITKERSVIKPYIPA